MTDGSRKAIFAAAFANTGLAIAKFVAFLFTGASSMLAESVHSLADTTNQLLLIWGGSRARREPTGAHPFGYGRERYFWAFAVAVVLFTLGSAFALYEGIAKLDHPEPLSDPSWAIGVLVVGLALEGFSLRTAVIEATKVRGRLGWWDFIRHSKSPELPVILLEDLGALLGLLLALSGIGLAMATGDGRFDAMGSIAIGLLLGAIAVVMAVEMKSLLIGESAAPEVCDRIAGILAGHPSVLALAHLRTQHLGPDELLVAAKLIFDPAMRLDNVAATIDDIEAKVRAAEPIARLIYLEPDVPRPSGADARGDGTPS